MPTQKILIIDGYNVINRVSALQASLEGGLENARNRLALLVSTWSHSHPATECLIVFDGDHQFAGVNNQRVAGVKCIFSRSSHGGDDEIIRFVREYKGRTSDITVVSDDNNVRNNCRAHGASLQPSSYILMEKMRHSRVRSKISIDGKGIDQKTISEVDRELRKKFGL